MRAKSVVSHHSLFSGGSACLGLKFTVMRREDLHSLGNVLTASLTVCNFYPSANFLLAP